MDTSFQKGPGSDEWYTPLPLIESLGHFDLDPCAPEKPLWRTADRMVDKNENGLEVEWSGRVWLNPPYSRPLLERFCDKMIGHGEGIVLMFSRTGNKVFQKMLRKADGVFFFRNRMRFFTPDGNSTNPAGCDSALFAFGEENVEAIRRSGQEGVLIRLRRRK